MPRGGNTEKGNQDKNKNVNTKCDKEFLWKDCERRNEVETGKEFASVSDKKSWAGLERDGNRRTSCSDTDTTGPRGDVIYL